MGHSKKYEKVLKYYTEGNWTDEMVRAATKSYNNLEAWITTEEAEEIISRKTR